MPLPSNMPTSFVPHATAAAPRRSHTNLTGAFGFFAYAIFGITLALAIGIFFYGRIIAAQQSAKDAALAKAQAAIDPTTVESFVHLRDRLAAGEQLLNAHPAFSRFFALLDTLTPATVRFSSLQLSLDDTGTADLDGSGTAASFNALAVASAAFAKDGSIKNAIFSHIVVSPTSGSVSFELTATLDPKLIAFSPQEYAVSSLSQSSSTVSTSTASTSPTL